MPLTLVNPKCPRKYAEFIGIQNVSPIVFTKSTAKDTPGVEHSCIPCPGEGLRICRFGNCFHSSDGWAGFVSSVCVDEVRPYHAILLLSEKPSVDIYF